MNFISLGDASQSKIIRNMNAYNHEKNFTLAYFNESTADKKLLPVTKTLDNNNRCQYSFFVK